jgi:hypothetical protein
VVLVSTTGLAGAAAEVRVRVDQPRSDGSPAKVDTPRLRAGQRQHRGVGTDGDDAITADRDRLGDAVRGVDGDHATVMQDDVGCDSPRVGARLCSGAAREHHKQQGAKGTAKTMV